MADKISKLAAKIVEENMETTGRDLERFTLTGVPREIVKVKRIRGSCPELSSEKDSVSEGYPKGVSPDTLDIARKYLGGPQYQ